MYRPELERNLMVCPHCSHHHYLPVMERIQLLADEGSFVELDAAVAPQDPLAFRDSKSYKDRLKAVQLKLNTRDAFRSGRCTIGGKPAHVGVFDFTFMGGSMGSVVGEKVTRVFEHALEEGCGAVVVSASGGARMQEGVLSLMQMAKSCAALSRLREAGLPYISIMCHPTTGGVAASFAMLGDINFAEPRALIGFAGPRVIEQTIRQKLPKGFQRAEYLLEHGMLDRIVHRKEMRKTVQTVYSMLLK
jgi:acetyl-CoA carboxylase carboxyl transferase subunit beta